MNKNWELKTLDDVCENIFAGGDVPKNNFSKFETDIFNIPIFANGVKDKGLYGFTDIKKVILPSITVSARGTIGYSEIRNEPFFPIVRLIVLIPDNDKINLEFLKYIIESMNFKKSGTSIPQLTIPMIKKYKALIPNKLTEQVEIVKIFDKTFESIEKVKIHIEKNIQNTKELFASRLNEIFSQKGDGWAEKILKELTTKIGSGSTPRGGQSSYKESGISLIRSMNVHDNGFKKDKLAFIDDEQAKKLNNVTIQEDDILLNITGASVTRCCIAPTDYLPARVNQHVSIIRIKDNMLLPKFLHYSLTSKKNKDKLLGIGEQGATRQAITKVQIENFLIKYPSDTKIQLDLITELENIKEQTKQLEKHYQHKLDNLEELKKSILEKAFSGELLK